MDEFDPWERPKTRVEWLLGNQCNYRCSYCYDVFYKGDRPFPSKDLILEVCKDIIYHYDDLGRDVIFEFIGGEPTLLDGIPALGERLHNYPTNIVLRTNGSASIEWWEKAHQYLSNVIITVHKEFADIEHIKNVVRLLQDDTRFRPVDLRVLFAVTQKQDSWDWGMFNVRDFQNRFQVGELQLLYSDFGRSNTYLPYTKKQWDQYLDNRVIPPETKETPNEHTSSKVICQAGLESLVIDTHGNVYRAWCNRGGKLGNIYNMPVKWPNSDILCEEEICRNGFDRSIKREKV